tara:strand:- start:115 stop:447 length:333 start_codon:yes stop_codon:yes gene_type:complete
LTTLSIAYRYGIAYSDYVVMDDKEINEAIKGAQYREAHLYRFLRLIAWGILCWIGAFSKPISAEKWWPLITDEKPKKSKVDLDKAKADMEEAFRKRDLAKAKKHRNGIDK